MTNDMDIDLNTNDETLNKKIDIQSPRQKPPSTQKPISLFKRLFKISSSHKDSTAHKPELGNENKIETSPTSNPENKHNKKSHARSFSFAALSKVLPEKDENESNDLSASTDMLDYYSLNAKKRLPEQNMCKCDGFGKNCSVSIKFPYEEHLKAVLRSGKLSEIKQHIKNFKKPIDAQTKFTPLHILCRSDKANILCAKYLLSNGAKLNDVDYKGYTALHHAATRNDLDLCMFLIEIGAKANIRTNSGFLPSQLASKMNLIQILFLEEQKMNYYRASDQITEKNLLSFVKKLRKKGVTNEEILSLYGTAYLPNIVAENNLMKLAIYLANKLGVDFEETDANQISPYELAVKNGNRSMQLFIKHNIGARRKPKPPK